MKKLTSTTLFAILTLLLYSCGGNSKKDSASAENPLAAAAEAQNSITAFQSNRGVIPPDSIYKGPLFVLNHNYPATLSPTNPNPSWIQALQGKPIGPGNALAYVDSLKASISKSIRKFLYDHKNWDAAKENWYQEPWTGALRESILGTYTGSNFSGGTFTTLDSAMTTYVLTMYDEHAAHTLNTMWGSTAKELDLKNNAAQFAQGSIIVKFAFTTANFPLWSDMKGADVMSIYDTCTYCTQIGTPYLLRNVSLFQFDIIVKDTITAPETGWVFSTLVYDKNAPGKDAWDKMIPLGAMWGNDPKVNSTKYPKEPLKETVINPKAPAYSTQTLGWGGRLSGPNDGAVIPSALLPNGQTVTNLPAVSCMSCHSVAQGPCCPGPDTLSAFLLPTFWAYAGGNPMPTFQPGGEQWMQWHQNRKGTVPFTKGQAAVDFDMVTCFKSMLMMYSATEGVSVEEAAKRVSRLKILKSRGYNGK